MGADDREHFRNTKQMDRGVREKRRNKSTSSSETGSSGTREKKPYGWGGVENIR